VRKKLAGSKRGNDETDLRIVGARRPRDKGKRSERRDGYKPLRKLTANLRGRGGRGGGGREEGRGKRVKGEEIACQLVPGKRV